MQTDDFDTGLRSERQLADIEEQANAPQLPTETDAGLFVRKDTLTAKGDLYAATAAGTVGRQALGTNGQVLTVDTATSTGLKYATPTTGTVTATGTLTANQVIIGNGGTDLTALGALGTTVTVLHGNAAGAPTFGAVVLTTDVSGTLPVANGGTNYTGGAWTSYTPTVSSSGGTITTSSAAGFYIQIGKIVIFRIRATITTNGTGSTSVNCTLPVNAKNDSNRQSAAGREFQLTGKSLACSIIEGAASVQSQFYDGTYPGADGAKFAISGTYEAD